MCGCGSNTCLGCGSLSVPEGPQGLTGPAGPAGADGADGADGAPGPTWMSWSWSLGSDTPYILTGGNGTFRVSAWMMFPGTSVISVPSFVKIVTEGFAVSPNYDVQLYDATNSAIMAQITARTQTSPTADSLTITSASWPLSAALIQIRVRDNNAIVNEVGLYAMTWHN